MSALYRAALFLTLTLWLAACSTAAPPSQAPQETQPAFKGSSHVLEQDPRIGVYTSSRWGFSTASYWIEGPEGLVVIDTQFLPSAARELIQIAEESTGKKVVSALVLHANPDKFNGTATFQAHGAKVITSQQVLDLIPGIHAKRVEAFYDRYAPDYPSELPAPESFGSQTMEISAAGLTFKVHTLGAGCSQAHIAVEFDGHLFVGDLVANGTHSWLEIGRTDEWLKRLDELEALSPRFVHPGRGASGGPELLATERDYLHKIIELVAAEDPGFPFDKKVIARIKANVEAAYPDLRYAVFLLIGLPAEYRRQARRNADTEGKAP